jgi:hypothetical protein
VAMETVHLGSIPKSVLQQKPLSSTALVLPKSSFNRAIRSLGLIAVNSMNKSTSNEGGVKLPKLRWGLQALAMIQRGVEWYVQSRLNEARAQSKRYYNDTLYTGSTRAKIKPARPHSRSPTRSSGTPKRKTPGGRSKRSEPHPTSNVYRYLK